MRDAVKLKLGGREVSLLPTFAVVDAFEDQFDGLVNHLDQLITGKAKLQVRAFLLLEGLKAANPDVDWKFDTVKERMFDMGLWHEDLVTKESEFIQRLMFTPEQYAQKKAEREDDAQKTLDEIMGAFSNEPSLSPQ